jgi:hypothetical protein
VTILSQSPAPPAESTLNIRLWRLASLACLVVGIGLRCIEYFGRTSQWLDEISLSTNIVGRHFWSLVFGRLDIAQSAPSGFLALEKLLTDTFGTSDLVLRLMPFLSSIVALIAFFAIAQRVLRGPAQPIAVALFATAGPLIVYAGQVKQYSSEVAVTTLLLLLALHLQSDPFDRRQVATATVAGVAATWFSQAAVFTLTGIAIALAWQAWRDERPKPARRRLTWMLAAWLLSAAAATIVGWARLSAGTRSYLHQYWAAGFMPRSASAVLWPVARVRALLGSGGPSSLFYPDASLWVALMGLGFILIVSRSRRIALLLLAPVAVTLVAAVLQQYPFDDRLILFLLPIFLLGLAETLGRAVDFVTARAGAAVGGACALLFITPVVWPVLSSPPPYGTEDIRAVLAYVETHHSAGDPIYVYYGAREAYSYYAAQYRLATPDAIFGGCHRGDTRAYLQELDMLRGKSRVWVVIAHSLPPYNEREQLLRYLDAIGRRLETRVAPAQAPKGDVFTDTADAYLFDLSDPTSNASATTFPVTNAPIDPNLVC